jgi:hypothetical protein
VAIPRLLIFECNWNPNFRKRPPKAPSSAGRSDERMRLT